jgi:uncharacterized membrane protein (UPF0127 family)
MKAFKRFKLATTTLLLVTGLAWIGGRSLLSFSNMNEPQHLPTLAFFEFDGQRIELEVAKTQQEQARGLQFRENLPSDRGMLFPVEPAAAVQLWMKDVNFPLDMIFLHDGLVIEIAEQVPPCESDLCPLYGPDQTVDAVVEVAGGLTERLGIEKGDRVEIQFQ